MSDYIVTALECVPIRNCPRRTAAQEEEVRGKLELLVVGNRLPLSLPTFGACKSG